MRCITLSRSAGSALLMLALAAPAVAQTLVAPNDTTAFSRPVGTQVLDASRGGTPLVRNDMDLAGTVADNTARNVRTGDNTIDSGSFANMTGIPVVIQNTGANVLIQNAVILHLQMN